MSQHTNQSNQLLLTSCQARNTFPLKDGLAGYIETIMGLETRNLDQIPWPERSQKLHEGRIQVGWICAKPYALQLTAQPRVLHGVAVPAIRGELYAGRPVYYSYLVVHREHPAQSLLDLQNGRVAYNEPGSQSGYFSLIHALSQIGAAPDFFSEWIQSGGHSRSITMLQQRQVDTAAIDSTLWDYELTLNPQQFHDLRIIDTIGPFPGPPIAAHVSLPESRRQQLTQILINMHHDPEGRRILDSSRISHFLPVEDEQYRQLLP